MKKKISGRDKRAGEGRHSGLPSGADLKKKVPRSPDVKGARASKKLNAMREKPSP